MKRELQAYRRRMEQFNHWENGKRKAKSKTVLLEEFLILYSLIEELPEAAKIRNREAHLDHLIAVQKRLAKIRSKKEKVKR
jgi:protein-arginine kinase